MKFASKDTLTEEEVQLGLRAIIKDGLASQAMVTFTGGAFLVAFALKLGASNLVIGFLAAIPPLMQLLQIPSIFLVEKIRNRRAISVYASASSRAMWLLIAFLSLLVSPQTGLTVLLIALALYSALAAVSACSWSSWMRDLVPQERLGTFFSKRMRLATGLGIVLYLAAGFYIDLFRKVSPDLELYGYATLFLLGFLAGMLGVYFISTIPEPRMAAREEDSKFLELILAPFEDANFRKLISFLGSWNFAINLAAPFFTVYMLKRLGMDISFVIALTVLSQIMNLAFLRIWGKFTDQFSNKSVLALCGPLFLACILAWTFTTMPEKHLGTIPLLVAIHMFMGISIAGVTLASGNIALKSAPKEQATAYLAANGIVNSLAAGIGPILGGKFADFFAARELSLTLNWRSPVREVAFYTLNFQHWDFFFFLAFLIGLYSIHRLMKVREVGEVEEKIVINEFLSEIRRPLSNLSTVGGLRQMIVFPVSFFRNMAGINHSPANKME
jgi:MFS family permease